MKHFSLLILFILSIFSEHARASHLMGGEVFYRHLGGLKYEVTVKLYRDCRGIPLNTPTCSMIGDGDSSKKKFLSLTLISIRDVTNHCKKLSNPCDPQNETISGQEPAFEEHLYLDTVDFNKADSAFKKYCRIQFGAGQCCRNPWITTGGFDFWVFSELNICTTPKNSSPVLRNVPNALLCCNQPVFTNFGAIDTFDLDSLSYEWTDPMQNWFGKVNWSGGRSSADPFEGYWPPSHDKSKGPNPNHNPPIGTYLDPVTGDLIFTPSNCSETTVASIKIKEWRKDSTGKYIAIGEVRRDIQYTTITCPDNYPPTLKGSFKYDVCANKKICFTVTSEDRQFIPPKPGKPNPPDTVSLSWNHGIGKGATFTIANTKALLQSGEFCWTPQDSDVKDVPYTFTVTARDNNCPKNGIYTRAYSVKVKSIAKANLSHKFIKNGLFEVKAELEKGFKGTPNYFFEILDIGMVPVDTSVVDGFLQSGSIKSNRGIDSVQFNKGGKYIIHLRINNSPLNCPNDYFDTLEVPGTITPFLKILPSEVSEKWVCKNSGHTISPILKNAKSPLKFRWSSSKADTLAGLNVVITKDTTFRVDVYDGAGYHRFATWKFYVYKEPIIKMGSDILSCKGDTVLLSAKVSNFKDTIKRKWLFEGNEIGKQPTIKVAKPGQYILEISDTNSCFSKRDSMEVRNVKVKANAGLDRAVCKGDTVMLNASGLDSSDGKSGKYYWFNGAFKLPAYDSAGTIHYKFKTDGSMVLQLIQTEDSLTCYDLDTVKVSFRPLPEVLLGRSAICQNENELDLHTIILKPVNSHKGIVSWELTRTLKKPGGNFNVLADLVYDKDSSSNDLYYLKADTSIIDLSGKFMDSIKLMLIYKDEFACQNKSSNSGTVIIRRNVEVKFDNDELNRCYGDSVKNISNDFGVNYSGGKWFTNNDSSNYSKWPQGNGIQLSAKLGTKTLDKQGGKYLMKYVLDNNNCLSSNQTVLIVNPFPVIAWTQSDKGDSIILTDISVNSEKREWVVNSKKMSESVSFVISKTDATQKTILLKVFNTSCETDSILKPEVVIGVKTINNLTFSISPNPVRKELLIKTFINLHWQLEIVNNLGQTVFVNTSDRKEETIDLTTFPNGMYNLVVKTGNEVLIQKFIKMAE